MFKNFMTFTIAILTLNAFARGIYPSFDGLDKNQLTIFEKQKKNAIDSNKKIILVFGHNKCASCLYLAENLKNEKDLKPAEKKI